MHFDNTWYHNNITQMFYIHTSHKENFSMKLYIPKEQENSSWGDTLVMEVLVTKAWSRNTLAGPANRGYRDSFLTLAFRKACWDSLGTVSYSKFGFRSIVATDTYKYKYISNIHHVLNIQQLRRHTRYRSVLMGK